MITKPFNWKVFFTLWIAATLAVVAIIPYSLTLQEAALQQLKVPLAILLPIQIAQNAILFGLATAAGLWLANRAGLGAPILEALFAREKIAARLRVIIAPAIALGLAAGVVIVVLDLFVFAPALQREIGGANALNTPTVQPPAWQGLLASFYGGIAEEIFMRLLLFSLFAFISTFIARSADHRPTTAALWCVNILIAILFGLGHLPATAVLIPITPLVVVRAVILNGIGSLVFGHFYWTRGLEAAMLAHFSADVVLHVIMPLCLAIGGG